ncbi:MAG: LUD domain-containing protein [Chitinophagaceae bacterium]|nr:LUD domain-containing protein [Chitinophagaceae bacterium]
MSSREKILQAVKSSQPDQRPLPQLQFELYNTTDAPTAFANVLSTIGGAAHFVNSYNEIEDIIRAEYTHAKRIISVCGEIKTGEAINSDIDPHLLEDVDLAIIKAHFGVAENAALWVTDALIPERVLPFITQQLAVIVKKEDIVFTMHQAYERVGDADYGFATFIAGPSKTADIEQSLVLGAHGPKTMHVFII